MQQTSIINKNWGYEEVIELNDKYCLKRLFMKKGHKCSLQYHNSKLETFIVVEGRLRVYLDSMDNFQDFLPGQFLTIPVGKVHRMEALEDSFYLEASTPHMTDVVRLEDDYGRAEV